MNLTVGPSGDLVISHEIMARYGLGNVQEFVIDREWQGLVVKKPDAGLADLFCELNSETGKVMSLTKEFLLEKRWEPYQDYQESSFGFSEQSAENRKWLERAQEKFRRYGGEEDAVDRFLSDRRTAALQDH